MNSAAYKRLNIFFWFLMAIVLGDLAKYSLAGGPNIINWQSFIHPFWVFFSLALYFIGIKARSRRLWNLLFLFYSVVFIAALFNQYIPFTPALTYNCMLFNLIFMAPYLLLGA